MRPVRAAVKIRVPIRASRARSFAWIFLETSVENQLIATRAQTKASRPAPAAPTRSTSRWMAALKLPTGAAVPFGPPPESAEAAAAVPPAPGWLGRPARRLDPMARTTTQRASDRAIGGVIARPPRPRAPARAGPRPLPGSRSAGEAGRGPG